MTSFFFIYQPQGDLHHENFTQDIFGNCRIGLLDGDSPSPKPQRNQLRHHFDRLFFGLEVTVATISGRHEQSNGSEDQ